MRRLLNTLYVTIPEAYLTKDGENILIKVQDETKFRMPIHNLEGIVCFGYIGASPAAMHFCCEKGVGLSFLTDYGKFLARVSGEVSGNVLLRRKQYRWADNDSERLRLAKRFISAKISNSRRVLQRAKNDHGDVLDLEKFEKVISYLKDTILRLDNAISLDVVRGIEGEAAHLYFSCFDELIINQKDSFSFTERNRRPPTDKVNALLSFIYTLLTHECTSALETVGIDPQVGFLHCDRPGRKSLALDLVEELRPYLADRLVLSLINRKQLTQTSFYQKESSAILLTDEARKEVLSSWQTRKKEEIEHPFLKEKIPIGLIPYVQAMLLARNIRGDIEDYPPFFWK
ncbi:MAG: type I-C CRISPR-associated endonuclease Cas1c [Clostridia bacterium]|nr:type I-C CRISPR-associated endonuclease Cas1c [Clostridia bacterium]